MPILHYLRLAGLAVAALVGAACIAFVAISWHSAVAPVPPPARGAFAQDTVVRGAELAAIGDCAVCHTSPDGHAFAGGRGIPTPFGTVYATNITPDPDTGIGHWSEAAFARAMRDGIDREGRHLYPVLPYTHFTRATDDDIAALYAFLMTRAPVQRIAPPDALPFPMNLRFVMAGWNMLYLEPGAWEPDTRFDATWNRGEYLVEAVGHCGACHTPRTVLGGERARYTLTGGNAEGWYAPPLQVESPAPRRWTVDALETYLRTGFEAEHGAAAGPMTAVTAELATVPAADVHAMAVYVASQMPPSAAVWDPIPAKDADQNEAMSIFAGACAGCHGSDAPMMRNGAPSLSLATTLNADTADNVIQVLLHGIPWRDGRAQPYMPAFGATLTDDQVAKLAAYLRAHYTDREPWTDLPRQVAAARQEGGS